MSEERRAQNLELYQAVTRIETKLDTLMGPKGRIEILEDAQEKQETRSWIQTGVLLPVLTGLHIAARKLGL